MACCISSHRLCFAYGSQRRSASEPLHFTSEHTLVIDMLPFIHKDPFDRILIAQSMAEGITLLTSDPIVAQYPGPIRLV